MGMCRSDFALAMANPFVSDDLLSHGLCAVGVNADEFGVRNAVWLQHMQRTCSMCPVRIRCRHTLMRGEFERRHDEFCPNRDDLARVVEARVANA